MSLRIKKKDLKLYNIKILLYILFTNNSHDKLGQLFKSLSINFKLFISFLFIIF